MQRTTGRTQPVITCDGTGVVPYAGTVLLAELADRIGLPAGLSEATDGQRDRRTGHGPGRVLVAVAVAIADGAVTISDVQALADQQGLHGPAGSVASTSTIWRVLHRVAAGQVAPANLLLTAPVVGAPDYVFEGNCSGPARAMDSRRLLRVSRVGR